MNKDLFDTTAGAENIQPESAIMLFNFNGNEVRVSKDQNGEPWFVAKDVADILGYRTANDMTRRLDDEEKGYAKTRTLGGVQEIVIINESGLYNCVFGSSKEEAKDYRYMPEPDLPPVNLTNEFIEAEAEKLPLMPVDYRKMFNETIKPEILEVLLDYPALMNKLAEVAGVLSEPVFSEAGLEFSSTS